MIIIREYVLSKETMMMIGKEKIKVEIGYWRSDYISDGINGDNNHISDGISGDSNYISDDIRSLGRAYKEVAKETSITRMR